MEQKERVVKIDIDTSKLMTVPEKIDELRKTFNENEAKTRSGELSQEECAALNEENVQILNTIQELKRLLRSELKNEIKLKGVKAIYVE